MSVGQLIQQLIQKTLKELDIDIKAEAISIDKPHDLSKGDCATGVALKLAKQAGKNPVELAVLIVSHITAQNPKEFEKVEVAGPGFINFYLSPSYITETINAVLKEKENFGKTDLFAHKRVVIDYTDPNPFKEFHIGHLMSNVIGEFIATAHEWGGAEVKRVSYQGDVGRHVAVTLYGLRFMKDSWPADDASVSEKASFLGKAYALGSSKTKREKNEQGEPLPLTPEQQEIESEVQNINKKIYERSDEEVNAVYDKGREWSLEAFEEIYKDLGTTFDHYFFESQTFGPGLEIVRKNIGPVFEESNGAIVYKADEKHPGKGLHTRVFINSQGLPTYEAKDLGLAKCKAERFDDKLIDISFITTASEQNDNFKVVIEAMKEVLPHEGEVTEHIGHGMLRFAAGQGKISSRTGNIITGKSLITDAKEEIAEIMKDREIPEDKKDQIATIIAVGAIKFAILRQAIGRDIIFDAQKAFSIEGDSGPYLQYTHTRINSILKKADEKGIKVTKYDASNTAEENQKVSPQELELSRYVVRFKDVVLAAQLERAPQHIITYLLEICGLFNGFYAQNQIVSDNTELSIRLVSLSEAVGQVIKNGLTILGIKVPERM